jgi:hypothetical protein
MDICPAPGDLISLFEADPFDSARDALREHIRVSANPFAVSPSR